MTLPSVGSFKIEIWNFELEKVWPRVCSPLPLFKALRHSSGVVNFRSSRALLLKHFYGAAGAASVTAAAGA